MNNRIVYYVDYFLDRITMYRLALYYLLILVGVLIVFSFFGILAYSGFSIAFSALYFTAVCWIANKVFSSVFNAPTNAESVYISALILTLIVSPLISVQNIIFMTWIGILAMASKYIFAIGKKHIFNPVAIAAVLTTVGLGQSASWWVGNAAITPLVVMGGILIVRKIQKENLAYSFLLAALFTTLGFTVLSGGDLFQTLSRVLLHSSLFFFGFVMLTEPLTTPPVKNLQIAYGALVGFLFYPQVHLGNIYSTPELALVLGNIFSYLVSPKQKLLLTLREKIQVSPSIMDFLFTPSQKLVFIPGQYMEWTLPHKNSDSRGNRRYFTIASSPTEDALRLGVRFYENGSSYKKSLLKLDNSTSVVASQLAGDFILPKNPSQRLVFIAGGIGITPFRSIIKYLIDMNEVRPIVILYAAKTTADIIYTDILEEARGKLNIKTIYTLTDKSTVPQDWRGKVGRIDSEVIRNEVPDYDSRVFYLSGPHSMVTEFEKTLLDMGIKQKQIKMDFFPGFV